MTGLPGPGRGWRSPRVVSTAVVYGVAALTVTFMAVSGLGAPAAGAAEPVRSASRPAVPSGACPGGSGVTVVVDPGDLGGSVQALCAADSPSNGIEALRMAGFDVESTISFSGFVCRIDGKPTPKRDACISTPPADAYWSYWVADRGGPWCYADVGATGRTPAQGTIEGWSFSRSGDDLAPRGGTFERLEGAQRLPLSECDRGPAPATTAPPSRTPLPPTSTAPLPPLIASATTVAAQPNNPAAPETTLPDPTTSTVAPSSTTVQSTTSTSEPAPVTSSTAETEDREQAASTVELADSGRSGPASAVGTAVAVSAMAALVAGAFVVNRRRLKPLEAGADSAAGPGVEPQS